MRVIPSHVLRLSNPSRNLGIIAALFGFITYVYLTAAEYVSLQGSKGETLLFPRRSLAVQKQARDEEFQHSNPDLLPAMKEHYLIPLDQSARAACAPFIWTNLSYDVKMKRGYRKLLNDIQGYVRPGTLTAVMVSNLNILSPLRVLKRKQ